MKKAEMGDRSRKFDEEEQLAILAYEAFCRVTKCKDDPAFARKYKSRVSASVVVFK